MGRYDHDRWVEGLLTDYEFRELTAVQYSTQMAYDAVE